MANAQIQMGETISILLVFFILLILGMVFYAGVSKVVSGREKTELQELESIEVAKRFSSLPEIQCSQSNVKEMEGCIDIIKLNVSREIIRTNRLYYSSEFGYSNVTVSEIYPDNTKSWTLYNNILPDKSSYRTDVPVSLFDPVSGKRSFGILTIITYIR